ncbi:MAG: mannonate dehydratase [Phaeodactylibacter sp.]|uniref:mannonate dehydratase n=1 Tax=Phaeodactylibacter sp. TaxID=1940289 RepID=UPI0032EB55BA
MPLKQLEQTWRWFGDQDPVSLSDIRQAGATGIVSALHNIPIGEVWPVASIRAHQAKIEAAGLTWSVVESVPVHDEIKRKTGDWERYTENYRQTLSNLGACRIPVVTYNFMPVLDWTRTDLRYPVADGSLALRYDATALAAFDLFLLERPKAVQDYDSSQLQRARAYFAQMGAPAKEALIKTLIAGLPGTDEGYDLNTMREKVALYQKLTPEAYRQNLLDFLAAIVPAAEAADVRLAIHPDDPPFSILGLPRIVSTATDMEAILNGVDHPNNGLCFCTGSFGARADNDLPAMVTQFGSRIHFFHLRNVQREPDGSFYEDDHLSGSTNMYTVMKKIVKLQQTRDHSIPMRPDHGHQMLDDLTKTVNPGYSAIGRLRGLAELRGLEYGLLQQLKD